MSRVLGQEKAGEQDDRGDRSGVDVYSSQTPAVRGARRGREGWTGASDGEVLARALGWFSIGLGVTQLLTPRRVTRLIGARGSGPGDALMRGMGVREIGSGMGILSTPRPKEWVGTRIAGDLLDLATLAGVLLAVSERRDRTAMAALAVVGVAALDVLSFEKLSKGRKVPSQEAMIGPGTPVRKSITIGRPVQEVYHFWKDVENLPRFMRHVESVRTTGPRVSVWRTRGPDGVTVEWTATIVEDRENELIAWETTGGSDVYHSGAVRFRRASGGRGTVVTVEMSYAPPGGEIGAALLRAIRKEPGQQIGDDLRRLKQVLETGEVLVSDATAGSGPRPARPAEPTRTLEIEQPGAVESSP